MKDWRTKLDDALQALEREKRPSVRSALAKEIWELSLDHLKDASDFGPALLRLLGDRQEEVRRNGLKLARVILSPDQVMPMLLARLSDPETGVRVEAVGILADMESPSCRVALTNALEDRSFAARFEAARGLAALGYRGGVEVLVQALDEPPLRFRALGALAQLGDPSALPAVRKAYARWFMPSFERTQAAGAMAKLGDPEGGAYLLRRTRRRHAMDRAFAIELCGEVKAPGAFERLMEILVDRADPCRGAAARGLGRLGNPDALASLVDLFQEKAASADLRLDAAEGLCLLGIPEARKVVESESHSMNGFAPAELAELLEQRR